MVTDDGYRRRMCFLDVDERRWYSIPVDDSLLAPTDRNYPRLLAADDGLVCELSEIPEEHEKCNVVLFDPVAKSRWELPVSKYDNGPVLPTLVTVVDNAAREFKVFFLDSPSPSPLSRRSFEYESSSDNWLELLGPPERLGVCVVQHPDGRDREDSAVFFQGNLYTISWHHKSRIVLVLSYNPKERKWREVLAMPNRFPGYPQLVVAGNRLFMAMMSNDYSGSRFEIREVLINENSSRSLVHIWRRNLEKIFGDEYVDYLQVALTCGFPLKSNSVVLISDQTGKAVTYDIWTRSFAPLPVHPFRQEWLDSWEHDSDEEEEARRLYEEETVEAQEVYDQHRLPDPLYRAKLMSLSLRNILSGSPVTSGLHT